MATSLKNLRAIQEKLEQLVTRERTDEDFENLLVSYRHRKFMDSFIRN